MNEECMMEMPIYDLPYKILCKVFHVELKVFHFHGIACLFYPFGTIYMVIWSSLIDRLKICCVVLCEVKKFSRVLSVLS